MMSNEQQERARRFGDYLRDLRDAEGVTQREVFDKTGVSVPYISAIERGVKNVPSRIVIRRLAKAFTRASYDDLLRAAGYPVPDLPESHELPPFPMTLNIPLDDGPAPVGHNPRNPRLLELFEMAWWWVLHAPDSAAKQWLENENISNKAKAGFIESYQQGTGRLLMTTAEMRHIVGGRAR
jgi:transcriptional regulator with XRE-family HTH domain